ncbi:MAG: outer membrane beta-barrel protein [Siphonobacter sp.]
MKQFCYLFFLASLLNLTLAQAQEKARSFVEVFGGIAGVSGNFSKNDYSNPASGFARTGANLGIQGAWFPGKHFGIGATIVQADYKVHTQSLAEGYLEDFDVDEATVSSKHYQLRSLLVGPYYSFTCHKFTLDLRALVGISNTTLPALNVGLEDESSFTQNKATATSFAYQLGAGLRYAIFSHLGLALRGDYASTKPDFSVSYTNLNNSSGRTISMYHEKINGFNGTIGIFYQF